MNLREEILEATETNGMKIYSSKDREDVDKTIATLADCFNSIGRADAANVLKNVKSGKFTGIKLRYLNKMADMIKQYKDF